MCLIMLRRVQNLIVKKMNLYDVYFYFGRDKYIGYYSKLISSHKRNVFMLMLPNYGNIGDQAIAVASKRFLTEKFPNYNIVEVNIDDTYRHLHSITKSCDKNDIFVLQGGGNMGDLYPYIENLRLFCIRHLKKFKVVSFPTSTFYTDSVIGRFFLKRSKHQYSNTCNLTLFARDIYSYEFMKKNFEGVEIKLVPDIVFFLGNYTQQSIEKRNIRLLCLRREKESELGIERDKIIKQLMDVYSNAVISDTMVDRIISDYVRESEVLSTIRLFSSAQVVVTDRMHGMVFSAITGAPCVVLKSKGLKIPGTYEWIKTYDNFIFCDSFKIEDIIASIDLVEKNKGSIINLNELYRDLESTLNHQNDGKKLS